jgi:hypothetical protein
MVQHDDASDRAAPWSGILRQAEPFTRESSPHLEPEDSPFSPPSSLGIRVYEVFVARNLLEATELEARSVAHGERRKEIASLACLPSFGPEWALWVVGERKTAFSVLLTEAEYSIWLSSQGPEVPASVPVTQRRRELTTDLGGAICDIWSRSLSQTRYPAGEPIRGVDGTSYHFAYWTVCVSMAGKVWSPRGRTVPSRLAALGHLLKDYVQESAHSSQPIVQRIKEHIAWFRQEDL